MSILRKILIPFSLLYGLAIGARNIFYDTGILKSRSYPLPVICVGNLSMGGTGKTPMIEYLLRLLHPSFKTAALSRGYGRKTKGFFLLKGSEAASKVGDEPLQFKTKFPEAIIAVDEDRQRGISKLQTLFSPEVVLLDDAFQHRKVKPGFSILLTSYGKLYSEDLILPAGNLREPASGAARADIIVVTKCPEDLTIKQQQKIWDKLGIKQGQHLFFSFISYKKHFRNEKVKLPIKEIANEKVTLVTGIANPEPLCEFLQKQELQFDHLKFPDHHNFSTKDLEKISKAPVVITTEKDFMRLKDRITHPALYYIPIEFQFLGDLDRAKFNALIERFVTNKK
jgi:tetraacyldisaccharide 4'-kinase